MRTRAIPRRTVLRGLELLAEAARKQVDDV